MDINKEHFMYSLLIVKNSKTLISEFEADNKTPFNTDLIKASFNANLLKESVIQSIQRLAPICFDINGKTFVVGDTKGGFDYVGDKCYEQDAIELFDMTTEMKNGQSYSFYASTTSYFALATVEETIKVIEFLRNLK